MFFPSSSNISLPPPSSLYILYEYKKAQTIVLSFSDNWILKKKIQQKDFFFGSYTKSETEYKRDVLRSPPLLCDVRGKFVSSRPFRGRRIDNTRCGLFGWYNRTSISNRRVWCIIYRDNSKKHKLGTWCSSAYHSLTYEFERVSVRMTIIIRILVHRRSNTDKCERYIGCGFGYRSDETRIQSLRSQRYFPRNQ